MCVCFTLKQRKGREKITKMCVYINLISFHFFIIFLIRLSNDTLQYYFYMYARDILLFNIICMKLFLNKIYMEHHNDRIDIYTVFIL